MKRENFVKIIEAIQAQQEIEREFCQNLAEVLDGHFVATISSKLIESIISVLEDELDDKMDRFGSNIQWWLYEHGKKVVDIDGVERIIETPGQLYDFITMEESCQI